MKDVKCRNCNRYRHEWCRCIDDSPDPDILRGCSYFIQKTNADHIRSMTDEELAVFLECFEVCHYCPEHERLENEPLLRGERCDEDCEKHMLDWLKQPYGGE